jgi:predicted nucleotidyltransferase
MNQIVQILQQHKEELFKKYPLKSMALFGSYSRGEETAVELSVPDGMAFIRLSHELEEIIKIKVDLVSKGGIKERYMKAIENDLLYV